MVEPTDPMNSVSPVARDGRKIGLWTAIGVIIIILLSITGYSVFVANKSGQAPATTTPTTSTTAASGVTWLDSPQKLDDLKLFTNLTKYYGDTLSGTEISYYRVGTDNSKDLIVASVPLDSPGGPVYGLFLKTDSSNYSLLKKESTDLYTVDTGALGVPDLAPTVSVDSSKSYPELAYQKTLTVKGQSITNYNKSYGFFASATDLAKDPDYKEFSKTSWGTVYTNHLSTDEVDKDSGVNIQEYVLKLPNFMTLSYQLRPNFVTDSNIPQITWTDGTANKDTYRYDGIGSCGSANGIATLSTTSLTGLTKTGVNKNGETIYEFTDSTNPTLVYFYNQYAKEGGSGATIPGTISLADYKSKHGVFVWTDKLGRLVVFASTVYGANTECGKPVVYLYPTVPTNVSVKVGANITKSEPTYGQGWNVLAMPSGDLYLGGKKYDSLFWEGTGDIYPTIDSGFVIKQSELISTLRTQLTELGLNAKEAADFMAFWQPKLPASPYVRVIWFGKSQLDKLAPLSISPAPDTIIRIFMDSEGLDRPINLPPQHLSAPKRTGFTVVEWGGLLREPSQSLAPVLAR